MKKMIFIELFHHHECIQNPYKYYTKKRFDVKLITNQFVYSNLSEIPKEKTHILRNSNRKKFSDISLLNKPSYIIKESLNNIRSIKEIKQIIQKEKPNYLYINTVETPFAIPLLVYLLFVKTPIILTLHNTNRLKVDFKKYIWFDFLIKRLIRKAETIILLGEYLRLEKKLQKKVKYLNNRPIIKKRVKKFSKTTFVMTGGLNYKEKDIEVVLKNFGSLLKKDPEIVKSCQLIILSKTNQKTKELIKKHNIQKIVKTYNSFVQEEEFEKIMLGSHYLILSVKKNSIYGKYKISGSYGDAVGFNLPILINEHFAPEFKDKSLIRFNENNLDKTLEKIIF